MAIPPETPDYSRLPLPAVNEIAKNLSEKDVYNLVVTNKNLYEGMRSDSQCGKLRKKY